MEPKFKIGDVVQLKSGGPCMTIEVILKEISQRKEIFSGRYGCVWFQGDERRTDNFLEDILTPVDFPINT